MSVVRARYLKNNIPRSQFIASSVWGGVRPQYSVLGYYFDGAWHLDEFFRIKHMDIAQDIMNYSCDVDMDALIWPHNIHGTLTSKDAYRGLSSYFPDITWAIFGVVGRRSRSFAIKCVRWQRPPLQYIKINVDGGASGAPGKITGGGVFRNSFKVFRDCFAMNHGKWFAFEAELSTALYTIELAHARGWWKVWLECDSIYVVRIFREQSPKVLWRLIAQWHKIRKTMKTMHVVVSHIYREGNDIADRLTREQVDLFS
ncbi:hypothetical protein ACS0TY_017274 [Phlomoides rotata]